MPCNPSIGGTAKGIIVREIDALGGIMGRIADISHFQIKMLNNSKGPAVRSLRAQADKTTYPKKYAKRTRKHPKFKYTRINSGRFNYRWRNSKRCHLSKW